MWMKNNRCVDTDLDIADMVGPFFEHEKERLNRFVVILVKNVYI